ncbi:MAG: thiamine pyrophosphate-dependent dehydrogenase E1 component subunit alpha [Pirellulaceae bacterium]
MTTIAEVRSGSEALSADRCLEIHRVMVRSRVLEERLIQMNKSGESHFWIGGPGEEAFSTCLGLQVKKGFGPDYDYLHLHYRNAATLLAMGMPLLDAVRQAAMRMTDPHSMGRNFVGHYASRDWNVVPVSSVIEVQFTMAPGTAMVQKRHGGDGVTVVVGGDAGSSEGDFASCMIWSSRPGQELPVLMIVMNNQWGISTPTRSQHSEQRIVDRGEPFGIPGEAFDGNDPIASWHALRRAFHWCRRKRRPFMLEPYVSRLHGHSSSSGALRVRGEPDCLELFERKLAEAGVLTGATIDEIRRAARDELAAVVEQVMQEPEPGPDDVRTHTYAPSPVDVVYPDDYTGLPQ